jgi:trigger factor
LKIITEPRDDHQVTMTVTIEGAQMEGAKHRAARKLSERKSIPGFRPGKVPYDVVVHTFGEGAVVEEAVDLLLDEIYPDALAQAKIEPGASGSLEKMEDLDKEPKFIFTVPLAPKVDLGPYLAIRIPYEWKDPGEDAVDNSLEDLRQMHAKTETVDRPIQQGDFVLVDITGTPTTSSESAPPPMERKGLPVFIRQDPKEDEWPFRGFSKKLIGADANETVAITHKYSKDHKDESLRGITFKYDVTIKMIRGTILPEINDEFVKLLGPFENVQALRESVKANLASRSKSEYDDEFYNRLLEAIKSGAVIKYSPQTIDHEVPHVLEEIKTQLARQGRDMAAYLKTRDMTEERFIAEEARPTAIKRLERSLILDEIARVEKIEVSKEMLDTTFQQTFYDMAGSADFQKYMKGKAQPPKQMINAVAMESANRAYLQQTLERLKSIATGSELRPSDPSSPAPHTSKKRSSSKVSDAKKSSKGKKKVTTPG